MSQRNKHFLTHPKRLLLIAAAFAIVLLYEILAQGAPVGIGFSLFLILANAIAVGVLTHVRPHRHTKSLFLYIPVLAFAVAIARYSNTFVMNWVPTLSILLSLFTLVIYTVERPLGHLFSLLGLEMSKDIIAPLRELKTISKDLMYFGKVKKGHEVILRKLLIAVGISVPVLLVFGMLFASADQYFADWITNVLKIDLDVLVLQRVLRVFLLTVLGSGVLYTLTNSKHILNQFTRKATQHDQFIMTVVLGLVNLLFAVFVSFQFSHLFGGYDFVRDNEIVFSEHARSGFFQLVWVIVLAFGLIAFTYRSSYLQKRSIPLLVFKQLLIILVGIVAYSALYRMNTYQEAYGYTVLRLYVEWFIYFVIVLLVFTGGAVIKQLEFRKFFLTKLALGVIAVGIISLMNVDAMIARENIERYVQGKTEQIDTAYLNRLSSDTIPVLFEYKNSSNYSEGLNHNFQASIISVYVKKVNIKINEYFKSSKLLAFELNSTIRRTPFLGISHNGITIGQYGSFPAIFPDSPAEKAGLMNGDVILSINGKSLLDPIGIFLVRDYEVGDTVNIRISRNNEIMTFPIILGTR